MGCKSDCSPPGWDDLNERTDYEVSERARRVAQVKWFSLALCLSAFVLYGYFTA